jgi:hypothetical protein
LTIERVAQNPWDAQQIRPRIAGWPITIEATILTGQRCGLRCRGLSSLETVRWLGSLELDPAIRARLLFTSTGR